MGCKPVCFIRNGPRSYRFSLPLLYPTYCKINMVGYPIWFVILHCFILDLGEFKMKKLFRCDIVTWCSRQIITSDFQKCLIS
jgi:hypothetical protein